MGAYMYPIIIVREPKVVKYTKEIPLGSDYSFTLAEIAGHVNENERFTIDADWREGYTTTYTLCIYGERLETPTETAARVEREEKYMAEYNKRHNKE